MSGISSLDLNQKLKEVRSSGDDDHVKSGATMSDSAKHQMPKTHQAKHAFSMKDRMGNNHRSTQLDHRNFKLDNDLISKIMKNDPSVMEKFFEKVVLRPPGGIETGIRIVYNCDTNNNTKPVRNQVDDQIHHHDDLNNDSVNDAADDGVKVAVAVDAADGGKIADGDEAGIRSLPYKKHGPYMCPKCKVVFLTSQKFAAHTGSHYKHETKDEKKKRRMLKMMCRNKKRAHEIQQQFMDNLAGGEGSSTLHEVKVEYQPYFHNDKVDAPSGFPVPLGPAKIKVEPFP
ncbi:hypothetical protein PIB30_035567 [Stylosanthes scabra]|uniref:C2H2-type domain-containing protein n=1 Tax=Stylosanthes scabra TaxID=79078 RepID=A0ABU6UCK5_9FABA|nr:hypothetical protein [Stylosanthes scabra]